MPHVPVLLKEVLDALDPHPGQFFVDGTLGAGGHSRAIIEQIAPGGTLLAVDRDPRAVARFTAPYQESKAVRVIVEPGSYTSIVDLLAKHQLPKADGLLLDLGFSSEQLAGGALAGRGFSFTADEPLLMTYDDATPSVAELLAELSVHDLAGIIREYGEERYAEAIAQSIVVTARNVGISTTGQLVAAIRAAVPAGYEAGRLHPATRTFQALRIYANGELQHLEVLLERLPEIVRPGGCVAIISFHSLEDRIVKNHFRKYVRGRGGSSVEGGQAQPGTSLAGELPNSTPAPIGRRVSSRVSRPGTKKPIVATPQEMSVNPRARSAKLRILTI